MTPSRSDDQDRPSLMVPSCASVAAPLNVIELPRTNVVPAAGTPIVTVGAVLVATGFTVIATDAVPTSPPDSVTDAVMVCAPSVSALVDPVAPDPITPSRSDDHEI